MNSVTLSKRGEKITEQKVVYEEGYKGDRRMICKVREAWKSILIDGDTNCI